MSSEFFDESLAARYERFDFDFPDDSLQDRVIVVAGGSGGLGAAAVALLVREGARVVIGCRSRSERAEDLRRALTAEDGAAVCAADITTEEGRTRLLAAAEPLGPLYGLVVATGDPARGADEETLRRSMELNYLAPTLLARRAAEAMRASGVPGSIVLLSSMQADYVFEGSTAYAGAKAAMVQAAKILAKEQGGRPNIRVNVVSPGATMAGMAQASLKSGKYDPFVASGVIPRFGRAEDVARAVRFLLEPDNYVTGQVLAVDGGMTLRRDQR